MAKDKKTDKDGFSLGKEDISLWRKVASTVQRYLPIEETTGSQEESFGALMGESKKSAVPPSSTSEKGRSSAESNQKTAKKAPEIHSGVDGRTLSKLKKGQLPIEAVLDLHGMSLDKAHTKCIGFLKGAQLKGYRCVLIITGKGKFSKEKIGIIKKHFPDWIHEDPLSKIVLSFSVAQIKDGGTGAFYVLLRKIK